MVVYEHGTEERMKDALEEALVPSHSTIKDLVSEVLLDVGALYKASALSC